MNLVKYPVVIVTLYVSAPRDCIRHRPCAPVRPAKTMELHLGAGETIIYNSLTKCRGIQLKVGCDVKGLRTLPVAIRSNHVSLAAEYGRLSAA